MGLKGQRVIESGEVAHDIVTVEGKTLKSGSNGMRLESCGNPSPADRSLLSSNRSPNRVSI